MTALFDVRFRGISGSPYEQAKAKTAAVIVRITNRSIDDACELVWQGGMSIPVLLSRVSLEAAREAAAQLKAAGALIWIVLNEESL